MEDNMSFDPETGSFEVLESFDPMGGIVNENFNNKKRGYFQVGAKKESAVFTLRIRNNTAVQKRIELFNSMRSIAKTANYNQYSKVPNNIYVPGAFQSNASQLGLLVFRLQNGGLPSVTNQGFGDGLALFSDIDASLCFVGKQIKTEFAGTGVNVIDWNAIESPLQCDMRVSCDQVPYKNMIEDLSGLVMNIKQMKIKASSEAQINNSIEIERYSSFGGLRVNSIEPSSFLKPENQQTKLVDINKSIIVDSQTGLFLNLEPLEDLNITFTVDAYKNNTITTN